jgi:hypothetical protein
MKITRASVIVAIIAAVGIYCLIATIRNLFLSEEEKIKRIFYAIADAAHEKSVTGVTKYLSADFKLECEFHNYDESLQGLSPSRLLLALYRQFDEPTVKIESIRVEVKGETAFASLTGCFTHKDDPGRLYYDCVADLEKKDNEWLITAAKARSTTQ